MTEWRRLPLPLYRNYEVSSEGDVRRGGRILAGYIDRYGYRTVQLFYAGLGRRHKVSRLVCETFNGRCPAGHECAHLDGNSRNDAASNLAWVSRSENAKHRVLHGTHSGASNLIAGQDRGSRNPSAKLTEDQVRELRERHARGESGRKLAREVGMASGSMSKMLRGETWSHVPEGNAPHE